MNPNQVQMIGSPRTIGGVGCSACVQKIGRIGCVDLTNAPPLQMVAGLSMLGALSEDEYGGGYGPEEPPTGEVEVGPIEQTNPSGGGITAWPAKRPVVPDHWIQQPDGSWRYMLVEGDTLAGLATTYLGAPQRWKEIWNANPEIIATGRQPNGLYAGELIRMPDEAVNKAGLLEAIDQKETPAGKAKAAKNTKTALYVVGGTAALAAVGGGIWWATRKPKRRNPRRRRRSSRGRR